MFRVEFFPAQQGDAVWIEYGAPGAVHRILIDAGTPATAPLVRQRIEDLALSERRFDLLVVTHVDTDHIGGVLKLLSKLPSGVQFDDVWFNAWPQIRTARSSKLGPIDGEILTTALQKLRWPWNKSFDGAAVMVPKAGAPPERTLRGGMKLTVLSPGGPQLAKLRAKWKHVVHDAGLDPKDKDRWKNLLAQAARKGVKSSILGEPNVAALARSRFVQDTAEANGSTIALLAEFDGKSVVLAGDAYPTVLLDALGRVFKARGVRKLKVDAFKIPHHGSSGNVSNELLAAVPAQRYVFSTSGAVFGHPDDEAVARVIATSVAWKKALHFNYTAATIAKNYKKKKKRNLPDWGKTQLTRANDYEVTFPSSDSAGIVIDLS
jgi:beta-lactamase superfamily II metal-dependent hydrolase